jgi:hypothetical protein
MASLSACVRVPTRGGAGPPAPSRQRGTGLVLVDRPHAADQGAADRQGPVRRYEHLSSGRVCACGCPIVGRGYVEATAPDGSPVLCRSCAVDHAKERPGEVVLSAAGSARSRAA